MDLHWAMAAMAMSDLAHMTLVCDDLSLCARSKKSEQTFAVAAHALGSNRLHLFQGRSEKRINDLKASARFENAVPIE